MWRHDTRFHSPRNAHRVSFFVKDSLLVAPANVGKDDASSALNNKHVDVDYGKVFDDDVPQEMDAEKCTYLPSFNGLFPNHQPAHGYEGTEHQADSPQVWTSYHIHPC